MHYSLLKSLSIGVNGAHEKVKHLKNFVNFPEKSVFESTRAATVSLNFNINLKSDTK